MVLSHYYSSNVWSDLAAGVYNVNVYLTVLFHGEVENRDTLLTEMTIGESAGVNRRVEKPPVDFNIIEIYPNPFNSSTVITYSLPVASDVSLQLFDVMGSRIKTLVRDYKQPGSHTVVFDADNYPAGVYFAGFISGEFTTFRKIMIIR